MFMVVPVGVASLTMFVTVILMPMCMGAVIVIGVRMVVIRHGGL
jgi:hypothetical protein